MVVEAPPVRLARPTMVDEAWETKPLVKVESPLTVRVVNEALPPEDMVQTPLMAKQPFAKVIPLAKVEVAVVDVTLRAVVWRPPEKVEVAPLPKMVVVAVVPK